MKTIARKTLSALASLCLLAALRKGTNTLAIHARKERPAAHLDIAVLISE